MPIYRIKPLKDNPNESYDEDFNPQSDAVDVRGVYIQDGTTNDTVVFISRDASGNLTFTDATGTKTLAEIGFSPASASSVATVEGDPIYTSNYVLVTEN